MPPSEPPTGPTRTPAAAAVAAAGQGPPARRLPGGEHAMSERVTCPSCQQTLVVPSGFHLAWLTCPRCLAMVPNPTVGPEPPPPPAGASPAPAPLRAEPPPPLPCPHCGKRV